MRHTGPLPRLIVDIETIALPDAIEYIGTPKIDKRIKDPQKIAEAQEAKTIEMIEQAPLDADLSTIALLAMRITTQPGPAIILVSDKKKMKVKGAKVMTEEQALLEFWKYVAMCDGRLIGFNLISFDLPFILRRSFALGVKPSLMLNLAKYRSEPITDLYCLLYNWDWQHSHSMKWVCKRYGIGLLEPDADGSMVKDMKPQELVDYGISDITATQTLLEKMNGFYFDFSL